MVGVKRTGTGPLTGPVPTSSLRFIVEDSAVDGKQHVSLGGAIDENADLEGMFSRLRGDAIFNMQNVERVNSMGVHRWIPLVTKFSKQHRLVIEEISYALVQNANAVANLFGTGYVRSCMAPYYCAACKDNCTMTVGENEVVANTPPPKRCPKCSSPMEFDELDGYFTFFTKTRPVK